MVNNDRIVPVQKIDLLSLYATVYNMFSETPINILESETVDGQFLAETAGNYIANQPVKAITLGAQTGYRIMFVADYDYDGFYGGNQKQPTAGDTVKADGVTLYAATVTDGTITITAVTPTIA